VTLAAVAPASGVDEVDVEEAGRRYYRSNAIESNPPSQSVLTCGVMSRTARLHDVTRAGVDGDADASASLDDEQARGQSPGGAVTEIGVSTGSATESV
jgi:hypothetical protein